MTIFNIFVFLGAALSSPAMGWGSSVFSASTSKRLRSGESCSNPLCIFYKLRAVAAFARSQPLLVEAEKTEEPQPIAGDESAAPKKTKMLKLSS